MARLSRPSPKRWSLLFRGCVRRRRWDNAAGEMIVYESAAAEIIPMIVPCRAFCESHDFGLWHISDMAQYLT
jgi:hypothetical protein